MHFLFNIESINLVKEANVSATVFEPFQHTELYGLLMRGIIHP